ncbi:hypothetical protein LCGC14_2942390 [marine sediment metagenome]|uniref:Transglycosylase SLT domain-containing protein n=1 Tax=marine sediment metagenome TaxID=412755 RepID=A0A0F8Y4N3_9ZZZZ
MPRGCNTELGNRLPTENCKPVSRAIMKNLTLIVLFFVITTVGLVFAKSPVFSEDENATDSPTLPLENRQKGGYDLRRVSFPTPAPEPPKTPELENLENETDPYYLLNHFSKEYGVDFELAYRIVECESNFDRYAKNGSSSAESFFQFIDKTFEETMTKMNLPTSTSKFDMPIAIEAGVWLLSQEGGESHWKSSEFCWL